MSRSPAPAPITPAPIDPGPHRFYLNKVQYLTGAQYSFQQALVITDADKITVTNPEGEILIERTRPAPGITYVGNARPPGPHTDNPRTSPKP
ncbi:hypothetical protein [Kribbella antiqua]|uniref:hypothetical protein n=1 Tax=Kribbella antiqua TaxID=2512217 RepID=UPI003BAE4233